MKRFLFFLVAISFFSPFTTTAQNYVIDQTHSTVLMKVQRFGVVHVYGRFGEINGQLSYNPDNPSNTSGTIEVTVSSYTANNAGGEVSAKGPAFLDGDNHPKLSLQIKNVAVKDGDLNITADLTIKGVTQEVNFDAIIIGPKMDLPTQKQSIALSGVMEIERLDYGVGPNRNLPDGTEIIGNKVSIIMEFLAIAG